MKKPGLPLIISSPPYEHDPSVWMFHPPHPPQDTLSWHLYVEFQKAQQHVLPGSPPSAQRLLKLQPLTHVLHPLIPQQHLEQQLGDATQSE